MTDLTRLCDELERLARAATPGPWEVDDDEGDGPWVCIAEGDPIACVQDMQDQTDANAAFMAAAHPAAVLALVREARAAAVLREAAVKALEDRQCSQRCDGPHSDCICWYCSLARAAATEGPK